MKPIKPAALRLAGQLLALRRKLFRPVTLGVRVILVRDEEVLLVRHTYMKGWFLPGGGLRRGETLEAAIRREAKEEVGAVIGELRQLAAFSNFGEALSDHIVAFASDHFSLVPNASAEIAESRFFSLAALPPETSPGTRIAIELYWRQAELPD